MLLFPPTYNSNNMDERILAAAEKVISKTAESLGLISAAKESASEQPASMAMNAA